MHAVIETATFLKAAADAGMSEQKRFEIVFAIAENPLLGTIMPGPVGRVRPDLRCREKVNAAATELSIFSPDAMFPS